MFIPFFTEGSAVYFESHVPSDEDLESYPHVVLTDGETEWDPMRVRMTGDQPYGDNDEIVVQQVIIFEMILKKFYVTYTPRRTDRLLFYRMLTS